MSSPLRLWIRSADRTAGMPVCDWLDFSCEVGRWDTSGSGSLTVRAADDWLTNAALNITGLEYGGALSMDVFWRDMTTPLFTGPVQAVDMEEDRRGARVQFTFEPFLYHFLSRRIFLASSYGKTDLAPTVADTVLSTILRANGFNAWSTVTPIGYPVSRTNFGPVTVTCSAAAGTHATTINMDVSDGRRILEEADRLLEAYDLVMTMAESPRGTFVITVGASYQDADLTNSVLLSVRRGTLARYAEKIDYSGLENVLSLGASGGMRWFTHDATSYGDYGGYEGSYAPTQYDATAAGEEGSYLKTRFALPAVSYEPEVVDVPGCTFNVDYGIRDLVTLESDAWGRQSEQLIIGAKLDASGRDVRVKVVCGKARRGFNASTREGAGTMLGRGRGLGTRYSRAIP